MALRMARCRAGGPVRGGLSVLVGERGAQVGDGGDDELVVGQDAVIDGVGVGVGVQAGAEDLRLVHGGQQGRTVPGRCCSGCALGQVGDPRGIEDQDVGDVGGQRWGVGVG